MSERKGLVLFLLVAVLAWSPVWAQRTRGSIGGRVVDDTGGVIPGVSVTAANVATGVDLSTVSNDTGSYRINYMDPGEYELTVSLPGFKTIKQPVQLRTGESLIRDYTLEVGEVTEEVTVQARAPLLQSSNATLSNLIDNELIETLPLAQGNPSHLLILAPGASSPPGGGWKWDEPGWSIATGFYFHGTRGNAIGFTLNGINNVGNAVGGSQQAQVQPSTEAVQEMKISHDYDATKGHHSGTTMDVTMKTGTNQWHGSVYGFWRKSDWNAAGFFDNRAGADKVPSFYRRHGGGVNGPVFKDKTFFAFTFESTFQETTEFYGTRTVPTPAMLRGDLSALLDAGPEYQIYDPNTIQATGDGFFSRMPIPNNIIPSSQIHPISQKLLEFWPEPNVAGGGDGTRNFQPVTPSPTGWTQYFSRVDHTFSPSNRLFGSYALLGNWSGEWRDYYGNLATGFWQAIKRWNFGLDDVWTVSPTTILNFRYSFNRGGYPAYAKSMKKTNHPSGFFDLATLPFSENMLSQVDPTETALPHIQIQGFSGIHDETRNALYRTMVHTAETSTDLNRGNHNVKLGMEFRSSLTNQASFTWANPVFRFGCDFTNGPLNTSPCAQGQGFAAFLLGQPSSGFINRNANFAAHTNYYGIFIQDNWRATPELTFNIGIRWEYFAPVTERFDRSVSSFDFGADSPIAAAAAAAYMANPIPEISPGAFQVKGGITYAGVGGIQRELWDVPSNLFAPRFGFAYRFGEDTVLRGGYGMFHEPVGIFGNRFRPILTGFSQSTDLVPSFDNGVTYVANFEDPFPAGIKEPIGNSMGLATNLGQSVSFFDENTVKIPYNQRWSLTVQHMLPADTLLEVGYVGTRATGGFGSRNLNVLPGRHLSTLNQRNESNIALLGASFPNPFAGLLPGTGLNTANISRSNLLKPYPHFRNVTLSQTNQNYAWYHALETRLERRLSGGISYMLGYSWSKFMEARQFLNASDPVPYEVVATADRTHNFKLTGIWQVPFGRVHWLGGWQVSGVWQLQSGFPLNFGNVFTTSGFDPKKLPLSGGTVEKWFNTNAGFERNSSRAPEGTHMRTFPFRFSNLRSAPVDFWDISVIKDTFITEGHRLRFQAQFLNAFNHASFGPVVTNPTSGSFGLVQRDVTWPRRIMLGVKYIF